MKPPKITKLVFGYVYEWDDHGIKIDVRQLNMRTYELKGQITVSCSQVSSSSHLLQCNFNFSSSSTRKKTAQELNERYECDWDAALEQLCYYTLDFYRKGEPAIELTAENCSPKPPAYILEPFLIRNNPTILYGDWGSAKSTTSLLMAACCLLPWYGNPMGWQPPPKSYRTMYLDWETDQDTVYSTMQSIANGSELGALPIYYRRCTIPLAQDVEQISEWLDYFKADIIIMDSLTRAAGGDLTSTLPANEFWDALRKLNTTSLILAHVSKAESDKNKRTVFGSQIYSTQARCLWEIRKSAEIGSPEIDIALYNRKSPSFGGLRPPVGLHITFGIDSLTASAGRPETVAELLEAMSTGDRIKETLLDNGKMTVQQLSELLDIKPNTISRALYRLEDSKKVVKLPENYWGMVHHD